MRRGGVGVGLVLALAACAEDPPGPTLRPGTYVPDHAANERGRVEPGSDDVFPNVVGGLPPGTGRDYCRARVCREERELAIFMDATHVWKVRLQQMPYEEGDVVGVVPGDDFYLSGHERQNGELASLRVVPPPPETRENVLHIRFGQEELSGNHVMLLHIENRFGKRLTYRAEMHHPTRPKKEFRRTSTCPLGPGMGSTEMWPHPLSQLLLSNFRFDENASACKEY